MPVTRILVVDDFPQWQRFVQVLFETEKHLKIIAVASDGLEAVQKAEQLQPDLILLDIGLPVLNGLEAARRIRRLSPNSRILFLSQECSADVVLQALSLGAHGYLVKSDAVGELLLAVEAALQGRQFVSRRLDPAVISMLLGERCNNGTRFDEPAPQPQQTGQTGRVHEVASYRDSFSLVDGFARFVEAALKIGKPVIVIATETHRTSLQRRLQARGWNIPAAIQQRSYISLDVGEVLSTFMVDGWPDRARFFKVADDLIAEAAKAGKGARPRAAACGECSPVLWAQGKPYAAIQLEHLWDEVARTYDLDILCGYLLSDFRRRENCYIFERICAEHSAAIPSQTSALA